MPPSHPAIRWLLPLVVAASLAAQHAGVEPNASTPAGASPAAVDFLRDVRPILAQHCYNCHGPDEKEREGDLRLDQKHDVFAERDDYAVVVAGDADESELILRLTSDDPEEVMPPPEADDALTANEVKILRRWIDEGAAWQEHWAFVPATRPSTPPVQDRKWPKNDIDAFILAQLEKKGLRPSGEATRAAWLRRVTFDLIGLPPTPKQMQAFARDSSADAYATVVDRLLADERYGERMASDWLDAARYADSSGYQRDSSRQAWKWRDWVINALNKNMPFDQFTIEQLAGDLLDNATLEQKIATGFNRNHPVNTEAGEELDEYRSAYVIDRVHTTTTTWLGLTVACAQCHDHKYDPISQKEFYSFYGFFNSIKEKDSGRGRNPKPAIAAPGPDDLPKLRDLERRIKMLKLRLEQDDPITDTLQTQWEERTRERFAAPIAWTTLKPTEFMARYGSRLVLQDDGSVLATGPTPSRDTYDLVYTPGKLKIQALRIEVLPDPSLPHGASGRADDGRFILSKLSTRLTSVSDSRDPPLIAYAVAAADINQKRDRDEHYLTAINPGSLQASIAIEAASSSSSSGSSRGSFGGWSIAGEERKQPREAVLIPMQPLKSNSTSLLRLTLEHTSRSKFKSLIGRFRVSFTEDPRIREHLVPLAKTHWRSIGPFPAKSVAEAFATEFSPEKNLKAAAWKKKHDQPILAKPKEKKPSAKPSDQKAGKPSVKSSPIADGGKSKPPRTPASNSDTPAAPSKAARNQPNTPASKAPNDGSGKKGATARPTAKKQPTAEPPAPPKKKRKPKRLAWTEQRSWRDGRSATLSTEGPASATYLSRKIETKSARTARITFRAGVGAKVWVNGNLIATFAPEAPTETKSSPPKASFDAGNFNPGSFRRRRSSGKEHELHIGLRQGVNHLVVKVIGKGTASSSRGRSSSNSMSPSPSMSRRRSRGTSFTFTVIPEGDDVIDYETMLAVRNRAADAATSSEATVAKPVVGKLAIGKSATAATDATASKKSAKPKLTPAERRAKITRKWYRTRIDIAGRVLAAELRKLEREEKELSAKLPSALVMEELKVPRETHLFVRGDYRKRGAKVDVGTPSMLPAMPKSLPKNRLGLAKWLVSGDHPLTARVTVNRAWQQFFGRGIVSTVEDFGIRGAQPSHPHLLDWLATEFVASKWNVKKLHRLITLSATYRQNAFVSEMALKNDPDNITFARGPHQRLTAEMVRDQALAVSGLLKQKIGGESIKPHQPAGLWRATLGSGNWRESKGDDQHRRGLYVYWKRGVPYPSFMAFDSSKRETCTVTRTNTTTPLQALVTLNDPVYAEAGRHLGKRLLKDGGKDDQSRIAYGFRLVASRVPDAREVEILTKLLADLRTLYQADEKAAKAVLGLTKKKDRKNGRSRDLSQTPPKPPSKSRRKTAKEPEPAEAAAWAQIGCTLLNLEAAIRRG